MATEQSITSTLTLTKLVSEYDGQLGQWKLDV